MKRINKILTQFKRWLLPIIIGPFQYRYKYYSVFGEVWGVYRLWFGFIPIEYYEKVYEDIYNTTEIEKYVSELNGLIVVFNNR